MCSRASFLSKASRRLLGGGSYRSFKAACFSSATVPSSTRTARIRNTLDKELQPLEPAGKVLTWYMCGPTVYDHSHIGHARTYVCFDIMRRVWQQVFGHTVHMAMGMTDVDDKIIKRANERGVDFRELARTFEASFVADMQGLNVLPPASYLRVSEHIEEIVAYIQQIEGNGYAYFLDKSAEEGGGMYFDVNAFNAKFRYGKLRALQQDADDYGGLKGKRSAADFALWKLAKEGEPAWDSPFGSGRPGWHIECSAVASLMFGSHLDLHTGGKDLVFPHHNNEIAQCEAHYQQDSWATYWLHSGHVNVKGEKMAKSLNVQKHVETNRFLFCLCLVYAL